MTGNPALQVPVEPSSDGMPIGMQIIAKKWEDKKCIQVGSMYEKLTKKRELKEQSE